MRDVVGEQETVDQVESPASLAAVRTKAERVFAFQMSQLVEDLQVGEQVERVVLVRRVVLPVPIGWRQQRGLQAWKTLFKLRLVVHGIEA